MRAVIFDGSRVRVIDDAPEPTLQPGEALIRPRLVAIGPSDVAAARGELGFRGVLGHLFVGEVQEINGKSNGGLIGRRVVGAINVVPLSSALARRGLGNHAPERTVLGLHEHDGCFAERFTLPVQNLVAVPDEVNDEQAALANLLGEAVHASKITWLEGKPYVTIIGDGVVALLCAQVMSKLNASVRLLGRVASRYELCEKWGVKHRSVEEVGLRQDQDIVIECTGTKGGVELALGMVRPRGRVVLKSPVIPTPATRSHEPGPDLIAVVLNELELIGARCGSPSDALGLLAREPIDLLSLIERRMKLEKAEEALRAAGEPGALCVVMEAFS